MNMNKYNMNMNIKGMNMNIRELSFFSSRGGGGGDRVKMID